MPYGAKKSPAVMRRAKANIPQNPSIRSKVTSQRGAKRQTLNIKQARQQKAAMGRAPAKRR
ncbi:MAG: hypothetical protein JXA43_02725 [Candidatus Diapherotrites archaeon]|nr:hypothetical protein [Candidatus Diapherotrites archaeon]